MCAARVEVLSDQVQVIYKKKVIGQGQGMYELRDYDAFMDFWKTKPVNPPGSIGRVYLDLGKGIGSATVLSEEHSTIIGIDVARTSVGIGGQGGASDSHIILDETNGFGEPAPVPTIDSNGNILVIVTHQSPK